eukprot:CAMPEP_0168609556 /NCGR_PEP_ID=MMETSP0449_2-20121227/1275_1 /TAXON_ID=1082188 /ORGANISM="Strombidium rassoulzadegani, Strain ras09" /LENGTH=349 /DNA_ID=CAMNT_0008649719 /DNA_START=426 /DNA_END=1475 /DNA_ORIENTATION=-
MSLLALKSESDKARRAQAEKGEESPPKEYVIFPRIDQKTCLKSIYTANLQPIIIEPIHDGDELKTNLPQIEKVMSDEKYKGRILCVLSTTSCFAPRVYDSVAEIAKLCKEHKVGHVINSAYGLQCTRISNDIVNADRVGTVDVIVSSTDKNFMVPVGGSIVYSTTQKLNRDDPKVPRVNMIEKINKLYPGRASSAPIIDLFITYLEMGELNLKALLRERKENFAYLNEQLHELMPKYGERVLETSKNNKISIAATLTALNEKVFMPNNINATFFGSYLFHRRVSGVRVCASSKGALSTVGESKFINYGTHCDDYADLPYFTSAASIGQTKREIDLYVHRLDEAFQHFYQ